MAEGQTGVHHAGEHPAAEHREPADHGFQHLGDLRPAVLEDLPRLQERENRHHRLQPPGGGHPALRTPGEPDRPPAAL